MEPRADQTVEIKARCHDPVRIREVLESLGASFKALENQTDTFFHTRSGRLKLREGELENLLIGYLRPDTGGPKHCLVNLYEVRDAMSLGKVLESTLGTRVVVKKTREIFILGNAKFHIDRVERLGDFVEIEVLGRVGTDSVEHLRSSCEDYMAKLGIEPQDLVPEAYADLIERSLPPGGGSSP
ncbi:MAG: class IV adenylate cyclase [Gemmatimonadota bacterium]|nr:class IV adenylate cyclase [Gemmatimonadota bacterium]